MLGPERSDVVVHVRITGFVARLLRKIAESKGKTRSQVIRELIHAEPGIKAKING